MENDEHSRNEKKKESVHSYMGAHDFNTAKDFYVKHSLCGPHRSSCESLPLSSQKLKHSHLVKRSTDLQKNISKVASKKSDIKDTKSGQKMDTCVPSPSLINTPFEASPHSFSIYDQERPHNVFCGGSKINRIEIGGLTDEGGLDDNFEDSSLKNILTPELISSMSMTSSSSGFTIPWESKNNSEEPHNPSAAMEPLIQLGMDSDLLISDFFNIDSNDSKFSFPAFDFESMTSNPPSSCHTPVPSESKSDFLETSSERINFMQSNKEAPSKDTSGTDFVPKKFTMKPNFPPRTSQPPVGVVVPVKIPEDNKTFSHHSGPTEMEIKDSKLNDYKAYINDNSRMLAMDITDLPPQTVPSFRAPTQKGSDYVKLEPASPEFSIKKESLKRSVDDKWEDVKNFMSGDPGTASNCKRRRCDSGSSGHTSEDGDEENNDFAYNLDDDSDDDLDADLAHMKPGGCESLIEVGKKQKQYFWQYNVQAKGPKGTRLKLAVDTPADPHVLNGFEDPVFDEGNTQVAGIRHGGKARKGDGNEVTPNPHKLFRIGHQLLRLSKEINACQLGSDVPLAKRNESRKEKNKLASRACRLKKKAQHEANKIKLHGLEIEHCQINSVLRQILPKLREKAKSLQNKQNDSVKPDPENSLTNMLTGLISSNLKSMVAGNTTDYVNNVILTVERGDVKGGLNIKTRKT